MICSTVVAVLIVDGRSCCLWAGDSRCYLLRAGGLRQISHDHSYVQDLVDRGEIGPEAAADHPLANIVTNLVGAEDGLTLEERWDQLVPGDTLLLCSDGLCRALADSRYCCHTARSSRGSSRRPADRERGVAQRKGQRQRRCHRLPALRMFAKQISLRVRLGEIG